MEFMDDPFADQSIAQTTYVRTPSDRSVQTDICPGDSTFVSSRDTLDQGIERYEKLLAFSDWLMSELNDECQIYDAYLRSVQNPEVLSLQNSFDKTRTEKVLQPLDPNIEIYQDVADLYQSLTTTGMRDPFVSQYSVG